MQKKKKEKKQRWAGGLQPWCRISWFCLCPRLKANAWKSASPSREQRNKEKHRETRSEEKKSDQRTFLFIGLCMQQASKARAEQKSLVEGLGRLVLSSLRSTAEAAHLPDWGSCVLQRVVAEVPGCICNHFLTALTFTATSRNGRPAGLIFQIMTLK